MIAQWQCIALVMRRSRVQSSVAALVEQRQRRTNVQVPERSKGLVLGTSVFALAGSNPVLYTQRNIFFTFRASRPTHVQLVAEVPVSFSVEVSTLDFDSNIPGSNPGRTTKSACRSG